MKKIESVLAQNGILGDVSKQYDMERVDYVKMRNREKIKQIKDSECCTGILLLVGMIFMLCIFEPLCKYFQNMNDFVFDFYTLFPVCVAVSAISVLCGLALNVCIYMLFPRMYRYLLNISFSIFVGLYVQGNFWQDE